ncbi:MAG: hypothetical protein FGM57_03560 [Candidatus Taylorbacteria bacterium]|nr:hypothetical protein [Candidatus Taylorbacteria bacterium]
MSVVFDEEQRIFDKDREIAEVRNPVNVLRPTSRSVSLGQNLMMLSFALICVGASLAIWYTRPAKHAIAPMYREGANEETLRLIPERDRQAFIESLPIIENNS